MPVSFKFQDEQYVIVPVGWGERTTVEMCIAFIGVIFDNEAILGLPFSAGSR